MSSQFKKGQSGNPNGRPRGAVGQRTKLLKELEGDLPALVAALKTNALAGDTQALKLLLDRLLPVKKAAHELVELPQLVDAETLTDKAGAVLDAVAMGEVAPDIGAQLVQAVGVLSRVAEVQDLEKRLEALERTQRAQS